jgi:hypothetical protein
MSKLFGRTESSAPYDAGPSPVPWLADEVWRAWNPTAGAPEDAQCPIQEPRVVRVTEEDRARAPTYPVPHGAPVPPPGSLDEHRARLHSTPGFGYGVELQVWPVCCDRLATLLDQDFREIERVTGPLDRAFLEQEIREDWPADSLAQNLAQGFGPILADARARGLGRVDGVNVLQCRGCGRVYLGSYHP